MDVRDYYAGSDEWYTDIEAACCWREVWDGADDGRCIWHADADDKPAKALVDARADGPEWLDGASVPAVELGDAIDFEGCRLWAAFFHGTELQETSFAGVKGQFARFPDADLEGAQFPDADLEGAQFPDADLQSAEFPDADLQDAEFPNADLLASDFPDANLSKAQFQRAYLPIVDFSNADLTNTDFTDAYLEGAGLSDATLRNADLTDAFARGALFDDVILEGATLTNANLNHATLADADLADADLTAARLHETRLFNVRINAGTDFGRLAPEEADADWFADADLSIPDRLRWWLTWRRADDYALYTHRERLDHAETIYRNLQRLYRENSMPEAIDRYHVRVQETHRKRALMNDDRLRWLSLAGQRWVMGYATRPARVVGVSVAVVGLGALLYPIPGIRPDGAGDPLTYPRLVAEWPASVGETVRVLGESVYFSTVTFTTLGYGDVAPVGWGKALATVESFVGAFLLALLVYVLGRRAAP